MSWKFEEPSNPKDRSPFEVRLEAESPIREGRRGENRSTIRHIAHCSHERFFQSFSQIWEIHLQFVQRAWSLVPFLG
jgi:hypothetical protein